tara:strand:+ start:253 stop:393 length:141 start_codon:yes stop_codon:yes gene_type:complete
VDDIVPDDVRPLIGDIQGALSGIPDMDMGTVIQMIDSLKTNLRIDF